MMLFDAFSLQSAMCWLERSGSVSLGNSLANQVPIKTALIFGESFISKLPLWNPVQFSLVLWFDEDAVAFYSNFDFLSSL